MSLIIFCGFSPPTWISKKNSKAHQMDDQDSPAGQPDVESRVEAMNKSKVFYVLACSHQNTHFYFPFFFFLFDAQEIAHVHTRRDSPLVSGVRTPGSWVRTDAQGAILVFSLSWLGSLIINPSPSYAPVSVRKPCMILIKLQFTIGFNNLFG